MVETFVYVSYLMLFFSELFSTVVSSVSKNVFVMISDQLAGGCKFLSLNDRLMYMSRIVKH